MRKILFVVFLMLFLTIGAFAQEPAQQQTEKSLDELRAKWAQEDKDRELKYLADNRKETESAFTTYNGLVQQRDGELTQKLKRAVADGDETLLTVALNDIRANKSEVEFAAKWATDEHGKRLRNSASAAYVSGHINESEYIEHLNFFRMVKATTEDKVPETLIQLITTAKEKAPNYFTRLERIGRPYPSF